MNKIKLNKTRLSVLLMIYCYSLRSTHVIIRKYVKIICLSHYAASFTTYVTVDGIQCASLHSPSFVIILVKPSDYVNPY